MKKDSRFSHTLLVTTIEGHKIENTFHVNNPSKAIEYQVKSYSASHQIKSIELVSTYDKTLNKSV